MLNNHQIDQLITTEQWLEEIQNSLEFQELDFHPDLNLSDARQAIAELLDAQKPSNFTPTEWDDYKPAEDKPVMHLRIVRPWWQKVQDCLLSKLAEVAIASGTAPWAIASLFLSGFLGSAALFAWGMDGINRNRDFFHRVDWEATAETCQGAALSTFAVFLGVSLTGGVIAGVRKDV
ncbi:hypothetical protein [Scytonema sp. PCC 10023]|uniref:hypothetical protein n=1 Tax=Scytonema sp. PCC 10023 TaxID=1680591 RepID=UPI0039C73D44